MAGFYRFPPLKANRTAPLEPAAGFGSLRPVRNWIPAGLLILTVVLSGFERAHSELTDEEKRNLFLNSREDIHPVPRATSSPKPRPTPAATPRHTPRPKPHATPDEENESTPKPKATPRETPPPDKEKLAHQDMPQRILLYYPSKGENVMDSINVKNGKYSFSGNVDNPLRADLYARYKNGAAQKIDMSKDIVSLFIQSGNIQIVSNNTFGNATVTGSAANDEFVKLKALAQPYDDQITPLMARYNSYKQGNRKDSLNAVAKQINGIQTQMMSDVYGGYVKNNPSSPIALYVLQQYAGRLITNPKEILGLYNALPETVRNSADGKKFGQLIHFSAITEVGKIAPDFIQNDTLGNPVALSSYRGKYVLLQFWAGFAVPSRAENRRLIPIYNKYHAKGFDILGISLDQAKPDGSDKTVWRNAIREDKLPWAQVSDLLFWNNAVAKKYGVTSIPVNFLIDPSGKIIARYLSPADLDKKLSSIL